MTDPADLQKSVARLPGEREQRLKLAMRRLWTGIPFVDLATGGIRPNDLVLLGATSGVGKTELACHIAKVNAAAGKRVHYFALEAEDREIERRILYKLMADQFYRDPNRPAVHMAYRAWVLGDIDDPMEPYETEAHKIFEAKYQGLHTVYRRGEFQVEHFERTLLEVQKDTDLAIIDHLHYFDHADGENENAGQTRIMKRLRDLSLITGIPILLVAHLRKRDKFSKGLVPELEDFMGSSNIYKIPTQAVIFGGAKKDPRMWRPHQWPTYIRIAKGRIDGGAKFFLARCTFNAERNEYEDSYQLSHYRDGAEEFTAIDNPSELPWWTR